MGLFYESPLRFLESVCGTLQGVKRSHLHCSGVALEGLAHLKGGPGKVVEDLHKGVYCIC